MALIPYSGSTDRNVLIWDPNKSTEDAYEDSLKERDRQSVNDKPNLTQDAWSSDEDDWIGQPFTYLSVVHSAQCGNLVPYPAARWLQCKSCFESGLNSADASSYVFAESKQILSLNGERVTENLPKYHTVSWPWKTLHCVFCCWIFTYKIIYFWPKLSLNLNFRAIPELLSICVIIFHLLRYC